MKLTKSKLKQIIREELARILSEEEGRLDPASKEAIHEAWYHFKGVMATHNEEGLIYDMKKFRLKHMATNDIKYRFVEPKERAWRFYETLLKVQERYEGQESRDLKEIEEMIGRAKNLFRSIEAAEDRYLKDPGDDAGAFIVQNFGYLQSSLKNIGIDSNPDAAAGQY